MYDAPVAVLVLLILCVPLCCMFVLLSVSPSYLCLSATGTVTGHPTHTTDRQANTAYRPADQTDIRQVQTVRSHKNSCHHCKTTKPVSSLFFCSNRRADTPHSRRCRKKYCLACLHRAYPQVASTPLAVSPSSSNARPAWTCPSCLEMCECAACTRRAERETNNGEERRTRRTRTAEPQSEIVRYESRPRRYSSASLLSQAQPVDSALSAVGLASPANAKKRKYETNLVDPQIEPTIRRQLSCSSGPERSDGCHSIYSPVIRPYGGHDPHQPNHLRIERSQPPQQVLYHSNTLELRCHSDQPSMSHNHAPLGPHETHEGEGTISNGMQTYDSAFLSVRDFNDECASATPHDSYDPYSECDFLSPSCSSVSPDVHDSLSSLRLTVESFGGLQNPTLPSAVQPINTPTEDEACYEVAHMATPVLEEMVITNSRANRLELTTKGDDATSTMAPCDAGNTSTLSSFSLTGFVLASPPAPSEPSSLVPHGWCDVDSASQSCRSVAAGATSIERQSATPNSIAMAQTTAAGEVNQHRRHQYQQAQLCSVASSLPIPSDVDPLLLIDVSVDPASQ